MQLKRPHEPLGLKSLGVFAYLNIQDSDEVSTIFDTKMSAPRFHISLSALFTP